MNRHAMNFLWTVILCTLVLVTVLSAPVHVIAGTGALFIGASIVAAACIIQDAIEGKP